MAWLTAALTGASAIAGAFNNRPKETKQTTKSESSSSSNFSGSTSRTLLPGQHGVMETLRGRGDSMLSNPLEGLAPIATVQRNAVNNAYATAPTSIAAKYRNKIGGSGKAGRAERMAEFSRLGALADVDGRVAQMGLERQDAGSALLERLLSMDFGSTTSGSQFGQTNGTQSTVGTMPGNMVGGGMSVGLNTLGTMMMLQRLLGRGAGSTGGVVNAGDDAGQWGG